MLRDLPEHFRERARWVNQDTARESEGRYVLYWMRTAVRAEENPALDVARWLADCKQLPLLVYHALSEHYEYASDRHHTFMLEGARDVAGQLAEAGISYAFHLATPADRRPHLVTLAQSAAVVVTEEMPVDPPRRFLNSLLAQCNIPIIAVDTACVVPMQLVGRAYTRVFQYREAIQKLYSERLPRAWSELPISTRPFPMEWLPFKQIDLQQANIAELVAQCEIDHAVGPVRDTRGGSEAGYRRWNAFVDRGIRDYAKLRNNALVDGVSRMSAYLHYGMVSPLRIAREAAAIKHPGAEKFLDELLIWRELAYAFCFYRNDYETWSAIPDWARQTLEQHATDPRPAIYSWETLARGETEDLLWNAAQRSLLMHGELHNNVRMTWGKAILQWTRTPQQALRMMIDLNHRYALDGRDPASYGGILWCLGQFDRPFEPPQPVLGTVRPRPTREHARRLDPVKYDRRVRQSRTGGNRRVAIIGAGISGLFAARTLADHGITVRVFEKSRGVGGRMATRRSDSGASFDHGAQYFTIRDSRFYRYCQSWLEQGIIARWPQPSLGTEQRIAVIKNQRLDSYSEDVERFVGQPSMNAICKHLSGGIDMQTETRIARIEGAVGQIKLHSDDGREFGDFDRVVISSPAEQTAELLRAVSPLSERIAQIEMQPCWAAMVEFAEPITHQWVGAFVHDSWIRWVSRNGTKPGRRTETEQVVIHTSPEWTAQHWEQPSDWVAAEIVAELWRATGLSAQPAIRSVGHRWKYALAGSQLPPDQLLDRQAGIVVCGDWTHGARVEGAMLSGMAASGLVLGSFDSPVRLEPEQKLLFI